MVVDDSVVIRGMISRWIGAEPDMEVSASLRTGLDAVNQIERIKPVPGRDLYTTLDLDVQKAAEAQADTMPAGRGAIAVMNPDNGEILAMVSRPAFDPNIFSQRAKTPEGKEEIRELYEDPDKPLYNRVIQGNFPPGSTWKLLTTVAALNEGTVPKAFVFEPEKCAAPLPRAYQWADGSAYVVHVELVRKARGADMPPSFWSDPLIYQGGSDIFLGPTDPIAIGAAALVFIGVTLVACWAPSRRAAAVDPLEALRCE